MRFTSFCEMTRRRSCCFLTWTQSSCWTVWSKSRTETRTCDSSCAGAAWVEFGKTWGSTTMLIVNTKSQTSHYITRGGRQDWVVVGGVTWHWKRFIWLWDSRCFLRSEMSKKSLPHSGHFSRLTAVTWYGVLTWWTEYFVYCWQLTSLVHALNVASEVSLLVERLWAERARVRAQVLVRAQVNSQLQTNAAFTQSFQERKIRIQ